MGLGFEVCGFREFSRVEGLWFKASCLGVTVGGF